MSYAQRKDGTFKAKATFPITTELVIATNAICEQTGISFAAVCKRALTDYCERYERGELVIVATKAERRGVQYAEYMRKLYQAKADGNAPAPA